MRGRTEEGKGKKGFKLSLRNEEAPLLSAIRRGRSAFVHGKKRVLSKAMNVIWGRASEGVRVGAFLPPNANETLQLPAMSLIYAVERMGVSSRLIDR